MKEQQERFQKDKKNYEFKYAERQTELDNREKSIVSKYEQHSKYRLIVILYKLQ